MTRLHLLFHVWLQRIGISLRTSISKGIRFQHRDGPPRLERAAARWAQPSDGCQYSELRLLRSDLN